MPRKVKIALVIFLLLIAIMLLYLGVKLVFLRPLDSDAKQYRLSEALATLQLCGASLDNWIKDNHRIPTELEGLTVLMPRKFPVQDGWGRTLIYKVKKQGKEQGNKLYSVGPNGIDEDGTGDDIQYTR